MKRFGLTRARILRDRLSYTGQFTKRVVGDHFIILVRDNSEGFSRVGVAISKRFVPLAVVRNILRRQVKEFFRKTKNDVGAKDLVVRMRRSVEKGNLASVKSELQNLWGKLIR